MQDSTADRIRPGFRWTWPKRLGAIVMALLILLLLSQLWLLAQVAWYARQDPGSSAIMRHELARLQDTDPDARLDYRWVPYDHISNNLKRAVIAAEDSRFTEHDGIEWDAIRSAWEHNQQSSRIRGGSTITQQLAKNLFLSGSRSYLRKAQELVLAYMIEHSMDKRRILELYLNLAEWGVGIFGAEAAAQHYYGVSAQQLSAAQAARLAAMLPNPRYYDKHRNTAFLNKQTATLLARMRQVHIP